MSVTDSAKPPSWSREYPSIRGEFNNYRTIYLTALLLVVKRDSHRPSLLPTFASIAALDDMANALRRQRKTRRLLSGVAAPSSRTEEDS